SECIHSVTAHIRRFIAVIALQVFACSGSLEEPPPGAGGSGAVSSGGTGAAPSGGAGGTFATGGTSGSVASGGAGVGGSVATGGSGGSVATGGTGGSAGTGGSGGTTSCPLGQMSCGGLCVDVASNAQHC